AFQTAIDAQEKQEFYRIDSPFLKFSRDILGQHPNVDPTEKVADAFKCALWELRTYGYHKPTFYLSLFPIPNLIKTEKDQESITPEWLYQQVEHLIPSSF
ncbi:MAG: hypothetical protein Q7R97_01155, partial [Candidatus Daviesbacteria bacterium]|nr:hypothetical protein [Candidatus Daviesbacteria bacterium]